MLVEAGLWLLGLGASLLVLSGIIGLPRATQGGLTFTGPMTSVRDRLVRGIELVGLLYVAIGSVIVAAEKLRIWWLVAGTLVGGAFAIYGFMVWKQHEYRIDLRAGRGTQTETDRERWMSACADLCATWSWAARHPFNDDVWPRDRKLGSFPE